VNGDVWNVTGHAPDALAQVRCGERNIEKRRTESRTQLMLKALHRTVSKDEMLETNTIFLLYVVI
jgi:hypothetical protein